MFIMWQKKPRIIQQVFYSSLLVFLQKGKCESQLVNYDCLYFEAKSFAGSESLQDTCVRR